MTQTDFSSDNVFLITSIVQNPDRHEAVVECAGRHTITILACERMHLEEGMSLSEEAFDALIHEEKWLSCIQKALTYLDYGDVSKKRMVEKLHKHFDRDICLEVTDYLEEKGYINDLALAERYAENYYLVRKYGPLRIKQELYGKGFPSEVINQVMESYQDIDYTECIWDLIESHYPNLNYKDPAAVRKVSSWLARLGYPWYMVSDVIQHFS